MATSPPLRDAILVEVEEVKDEWVIARWEAPNGDTAFEVTYATLDVPSDARKQLPVEAKPLGVVRRPAGLLLGTEGPERTALYLVAGNRV